MPPHRDTSKCKMASNSAHFSRQLVVRLTRARAHTVVTHRHTPTTRTHRHTRARAHMAACASSQLTWLTALAHVEAHFLALHISPATPHAVSSYYFVENAVY